MSYKSPNLVAGVAPCALYNSLKYEYTFAFWESIHKHVCGYYTIHSREKTKQDDDYSGVMDNQDVYITEDK